MWWIWLVLLYGVLKGVREICKKKALQRSSSAEVLFLYSLISFLFLIPDIPNVFGMEPIFYLYIAIKSCIIFIAWICSFKAITKLPISLYGVLDLSRVLFATTLGVTVLGEMMSTQHMIGLALVCLGLLLLKWYPGMKKTKSESVKPVYVIAALVSCALNAASGLMDKILMKDISSSQLQFWYMLFLVAMYFVYMLVTKAEVSIKRGFSNPWIWLLSILFVIADRALFIANGMEGSSVTVMTLLKQAGCIVTILAGRFIFKEKHTTHKLICAVVIIVGIILGVKS
ncbi:MAG: EamA family transporter [Lachnospiraceae bacterium]|nr:EamA family transporter [Candidatus Merdinaster equi]